MLRGHNEEKATMPEQGRMQNRLLGKLGREEYMRLSESMERVTIPLGEVVCEPGEPVRYAHFPVGNVLACIVTLQDGTAIEAASIANEGMAGLGLMVDERASPCRIVQQVEGDSLRVPARAFREFLDSSPVLRGILTRYCLTLQQQFAQNSACNLRHELGKRICRWLLICADGADRDEFYITQELLSETLGVRRQSVNRLATRLQDSGLIVYRRGRLKILDRGRLESSACECYRTTRDMYSRLMCLQASPST